MARVALARRARAWFASQTAYLLERSPRAAEHLEEKVASAIRLLEQFPRAGAPTGRPGIRRLAIAPYVLTYREAGSDRVIILDIRHGRQRPPALPDEA